MKALAPLAALLALASAVCGQNVSSPGHSLSLDVRVVSSGGAARSDAGSNANLGALTGRGVSVEKYSRSREAKSGAGLVVEVRNLTSSPEKAEVEWYFFGEGVKKNADDFIAATASRDVTVPAAGSEKIDIHSPEFASREEQNLTITKSGGSVKKGMSTSRSGAKMSGWMVRLLVGGQVAAVRASSPSLEAAGREPAKLKAYPRKLKKFPSPQEP